MNIIINPASFNSKCIFFSDKKKNNIINGCFSKIIYSPEYFTMNGIFFVIPFTIKSHMPISNTFGTENNSFFRAARDNRISKNEDSLHIFRSFTEEIAIN